MDAVEVASAVTAGRIARHSATFPPVTEHKVYEIFGISRDVPPNYATREYVDGLVIDSLVGCASPTL